MQQIYDLRTGGIFETIRYDNALAVIALQFDSQKIIAPAGENGVKVPWVHNDYCIQQLSFFCKVYNQFPSFFKNSMVD